jgi:hypothetical protein
LALVIEREPLTLASAAPYLVRHRDEFVRQIKQRRAVLQGQFEAVDRLDFQMDYDEAVVSAEGFLASLG